MKVVNRSELKGFNLFNGVSGRIVFSSDRVMFLLVEVAPRGVVPKHSHPHEQMGVCLKGKAEFISDGGNVIVEEGMFYWIKPGESHGVVSLVDCVSLFLDVFNPPREDYIERAENLDET
ncbi:MAG: cupin domain-containing protein [Candidatus Bathyarchaeia archaeon]